MPIPNQRTVIPDGGEIQKRRAQLGLTAKELCDKAKISLRARRYVEAGRPCYLRTLAAIARVLECPIEEILAGQRQPRMAVLNEAIMEAPSELGRPGGILPRLLHELDHSSDPRRLEPEVLLFLAERRDVQGDARGAMRLARLVMQEARSQPRAEFYCRALVRTAIFNDHAGHTKEGLRLVEGLLKRHHRPPNTTNRQYWWAMYHKGTLTLRAGRLRAACEILEHVVDSAPAEYRIAARHQLGVLYLRRGDFYRAEALFRQCLEERKKMKNDFRTAYEYRRLGEVYARTDRQKEAAEAFSEAEGIAKQWDFPRYRDEVKTAREFSRPGH